MGRRSHLKGVLRIHHQPVIKSGGYPFILPLHPDAGEVWKPYPIFQGQTAILDNLSCHVSALVCGASPHSPHEHTDEEILIVLSGEVDIILRSDHAPDQPCFYRKRLQKNQFVYYPANFAHSLETISEEPANYLMFRWQGAPSHQAETLDFCRFNALPAGDETDGGQGVSMQPLFEKPTRYLDKLHCHTTCLAPGAGYSPHVDSHDVALLLLEGEVQTLGQNIKAPGVIFYEAGKPHGMLNPAENEARYLVFEFHRHSPKPLKNTSGFKPNEEIKPSFIMLDASSACQLRCPSCPTGQGMTLKTLGAKFLRFSDFKALIDANPWIKTIELSNWGEIFLNPEIISILEYGFKKNVALQANCGVNLNTVSDDLLEALVKYQLRGMTVSVDGASNETYKIYRVGGDFEKVIAHIRTINAFKQRYKTDLPKLKWQFVAFGHNEQEIEKARSMAAELEMDFHVKLSFGGLYTGEIFSPIKNRDLIRRESGLDCADRQEYLDKHGERYLQNVSCLQLWENPQIHADGRLLGCSINYQQDFGNVFEEGLLACLNNEKINYARQMLMGLAPPRADIPCCTCIYYQTMRTYVKPRGVSPACDILAMRDAQIAAIYHSTSWRITRPWRIAGTKVKKRLSLGSTPEEKAAKQKSPLQIFVESNPGGIPSREQAVFERDAQIAALYNSTSWRMTKPLRFAGDKARKMIVLLPAPAQRLAGKIYKLILFKES
ncbi:MAG: cupin domain-containing protein [Deltaproteobacteria bacterium]|nr:cupin domain-containing protein [Deltaproteobacteria bacterium]